MTKIVVSFAVGAAVILTMTACGQKGSLMLPSAAAPGTARQTPSPVAPQPASAPASMPR